MIDYKQIDRFLSARNAEVKKILEVGVGLPEDCRSISYGFIEKGAKAHLFEPHPEYFKKLEEEFGDSPNIELFNIALSNETGTVEFENAGLSSFVSGAPSPMKRDEYYDEDLLFKKDSFTVKCDTIDKYDEGDFDFAMLDAEGCEWYILEKLISRPKILIVETHNAGIMEKGKPTQHYYMKEMIEWAEANNYKAIAQDESDTMLVHAGLLYNLEGPVTEEQKDRYQQ